MGGPARPVGIQADLGDEFERLVESDDPVRIGVGHVEGADRSTAKLLAVRVPEVGDQTTDVGPRRALDHERAPVPLPPALVEPVHLDLALGRLDVDAGAGQRVRPPAPDLHRRERRRALANHPGRKHQIAPRDYPCRHDLTFGIPRGRDRPEPCRRLVSLSERHQEALHPRRPADQDQQQPRRERVERARMADLDPPGAA